MNTAETRIWIGPAGWSYQDWRGVFYPRVRPRGFHPLRFVSRFFNAVEVNASFYRMPTASMTAKWPRLTPDHFRFTLKLPQIFTHRRDAFPPRSEVDAFLEALKPLQDAGKLGPVLAQFPQSLRFTPGAVTWIGRLAEAFQALDRVVEVRHISWLADEAQAALRPLAGWCNIDQPRFRETLGPTALATGKTAYVRLHGRNTAMWFRKDVPSFERYNYLYSREELEEWARRIGEIASSAEDVYVVTNNHYRGQAPANGLELKALLSGEKVEVPAELLETYPQLADIAREPPRAASPTLFDLD